MKIIQLIQKPLYETFGKCTRATYTYINTMNMKSAIGEARRDQKFTHIHTEKVMIKLHKNLSQLKPPLTLSLTESFHVCSHSPDHTHFPPPHSGVYEIYTETTNLKLQKKDTHLTHMLHNLCLAKRRKMRHFPSPTSYHNLYFIFML